MEFPRLPRFKRSFAVAPIQLTERDRDIIRLVHRHRFLRSPQIAALLSDSSQQLVRRLQLLYHHGYLERPRAQIDYYHQGGTRHIIYGLGNKGGAALQRESGVATPKPSWGEKNRAVRGMFLEHAIQVSDVMVAMELACRKSDKIRLLTDDQLRNDLRGSFQWRVNVKGESKLGIVPDRIFALDVPGHSDGGNRQYFFLEVDRGNMPVTRQKLSQTSIYRKLLAYEATWSQSIHRAKFGFNRFRVLFVTTTPKRMCHMIEAARQLERGHGLFLFTDFKSLRSTPDILTHSLRTTRPGVEATLLA